METVDITTCAVVLVGDIHGKFAVLERLLHQHNLQDTLLIQVGDFGLGFDPDSVEAERLGPLDAALGQRRCRLLAIRGNHDDPTYWQQRRLYLQHIAFIPDYTVVRVAVEGLPIWNALLAAGAISVDRWRREAGISYWSEESFVYDPERIARIAEPIYAVVAHSAPDVAFPTVPGEPVRYHAVKDPALLSDIQQGRAALARLAQALRYANQPIETWDYGYFHPPEKPVVTEHGGTVFTAHPTEHAMLIRDVAGTGVTAPRLPLSIAADLEWWELE